MCQSITSFSLSLPFSSFFSLSIYIILSSTYVVAKLRKYFLLFPTEKDMR